MAAKRKVPKGNVPGAVLHGAIGVVPFGNLYEGYKGGKRAGGSTAAGVGGALASSLTYPFGGAVAGAYHGYHKPIPGTHPNQRNAKTAVRSGGRR